MCGVAGELKFNIGPSPANWDKLNDLMARRGPDDSGKWAEDGYCTLVFRRLAILDLTPAGHQPMLAGNGRYVLVFNGEVYNFATLREQLKGYGFQFRSQSDTEVVLYSLMHWGQEALAKFNGMFALSFYDVQEKKLLLARDHAGIKPLYYLHTDQGVVFASQYDQILAHPWSKDLQPSSEALGLYLRLAHIPAPYALLEKTSLLEPGTWLEIDVANKSVKKGIFYAFPRYTAPTLRGNDAVDAVDHAITAAVKRQLVSDVPLGAFLSGGIDSPLVVAKMREAGTGSMRAFTIGTSGDETDETPDAIRYAQELGVAQTIHQVTPNQALDMLDDVIQACAEPFGDYSVFPTMLVSRLARQEFTVMLAGDGGDELFWGYARRSASLIKASENFRQPLWQRRARYGMKKLFNSQKGHHFLTQPSLGVWHRSLHTHRSEAWLTDVFPNLAPWPSAYHDFDYDGWETDQTAQWIRWNEFFSHMTMVLMKVDRASMYQSLEVRVPLLDREVIDVAVQVDWRSCLDVNRELGKIPLRQILARHVTHQTQAKRGFEVPMGKWLKTALRPVFEEMLLNREELMGLTLDRTALQDVFTQHVNGQREQALRLWPILSLALWAKRHFENRTILWAD